MPSSKSDDNQQKYPKVQEHRPKSVSGSVNQQSKYKPMRMRSHPTIPPTPHTPFFGEHKQTEEDQMHIDEEGEGGEEEPPHSPIPLLGAGRSKEQINTNYRPLRTRVPKADDHQIEIHEEEQIMSGEVRKSHIVPESSSKIPESNFVRLRIPDELQQQDKYKPLRTRTPKVEEYHSQAHEQEQLEYGDQKSHLVPDIHSPTFYPALHKESRIRQHLPVDQISPLSDQVKADYHTEYRPLRRRSSTIDENHVGIHQGELTQGKESVAKMHTEYIPFRKRNRKQELQG